jgi:hypothetical protein
MKKKIKMRIELEVTEPQALTLQAMFEYMHQLSGLGGSRYIAFYADGDGDFHPKPEITFDQPVRQLTDEMKKAAIVEDDHGHRKYDYDPIGWMLHED